MLALRVAGGVGWAPGCGLGWHRRAGVGCRWPLLAGAPVGGAAVGVALLVGVGLMVARGAGWVGSRVDGAGWGASYGRSGRTTAVDFGIWAIVAVAMICLAAWLISGLRRRRPADPAEPYAKANGRAEAGFQRGRGGSGGGVHTGPAARCRAAGAGTEPASAPEPTPETVATPSRHARTPDYYAAADFYAVADYKAAEKRPGGDAATRGRAAAEPTPAAPKAAAARAAARRTRRPGRTCRPRPLRPDGTRCRASAAVTPTGRNELARAPTPIARTTKTSSNARDGGPG